MSAPSIEQYLSNNPYAICGNMLKNHVVLHTLGLSRLGVPEIFMVWDGESEEPAKTFAKVVERVHGKSIAINSEFHAYGRRMAICDVPNSSIEEIEAAVRHLFPKAKFNAAQLVLDDQEGNLPWEKDYVETDCEQPIFGRQKLNA